MKKVYLAVALMSLMSCELTSSDDSENSQSNEPKVTVVRDEYNVLPEGRYSYTSEDVKGIRNLDCRKVENEAKETMCMHSLSGITEQVLFLDSNLAVKTVKIVEAGITIEHFKPFHALADSYSLNEVHPAEVGFRVLDENKDSVSYGLYKIETKADKVDNEFYDDCISLEQNISIQFGNDEPIQSLNMEVQCRGVGTVEIHLGDEVWTKMRWED